jgi:hypothetical protein
MACPLYPWEKSLPFSTALVGGCAPDCSACSLVTTLDVLSQLLTELYTLSITDFITINFIECTEWIISHRILEESQNMNPPEKILALSSTNMYTADGLSFILCYSRWLLVFLSINEVLTSSSFVMKLLRDYVLKLGRSIGSAMITM